MGALEGCFRCWCGVGCAACWIFIGVWAFFFLGVLALLFQTGHPGNIGHFHDEYDEKANKTRAKNLLITWAIYVALTLFCSWNLWYRLHHPFPAEEDQNAPKDQFSAIGPNPALASQTY
jgi:hypothetical protein